MNANQGSNSKGKGKAASKKQQQKEAKDASKEEEQQQKEAREFMRQEKGDVLLHEAQEMLGSFHRENVTRWVPCEEDSRFSGLKELKTVPALIGIIDELISNAFDNYVKSVKNGFKNYDIIVTVDDENNSITIKNTGKGITTGHATVHGQEDEHPVAVTAFECPNFSDAFEDKNEWRSGRYGGGAKIANMYSSRFEVETCNSLHYVHCVWTKNGAKFTDLAQRRQQDYTFVKKDKHTKQGLKITLYPDLEAFGGIDSLQQANVHDIVKSRCYMLGAHTGIPSGMGKDKQQKLDHLRDRIRINVCFNNTKVSDKVGCMRDLAKQFCNDNEVAYYRQTFGNNWHTGLDFAIMRKNGYANQDIFVCNGINLTEWGRALRYVKSHIVQWVPKYNGSCNDSEAEDKTLGLNWEDADTERIQATHGSMVVFMSWAWQYVEFEGKNKAYLRATVSEMKILNHNEFNQERWMNEAVEIAKDNDKKNMALFGRLGSFKKIAIGGTIHAYFQSRQKRKKIERNVNKEQPELPDNLIVARGVELQKPASELTLLLV